MNKEKRFIRTRRRQNAAIMKTANRKSEEKIHTVSNTHRVACDVQLRENNNQHVQKGDTITHKVQQLSSDGYGDFLQYDES